MDKKSFSERDICTKLIVPALQSACWDIQQQVREEVTFTKGRLIVRGKLHTTVLTLDQFPSLDELWASYRVWRGLDDATVTKAYAPYFDDGSGHTPRYYQINAINRAVEAVARGQKRVVLVMATGTGKTYTAFQIIWRLWKSKQAKRILFLADRNILVDQTKNNDFKPFGSAMTKITGRKINMSYEIYLSLY